MSYWRDCTRCGQKILMTENNYGIWQPLELDGTGRHECFSGAEDTSYRSPSVPRIRSWTLDSLNIPLTFSTTCWWCGADVFFHTNGYGDAVLFDSLGWPWEIHACWEDHQAQQKGSLFTLEKILDEKKYDGRFYKHIGKEILPPANNLNKLVTISGYIADNHSLYKEPKLLNLFEHDTRDSNLWTKLMVCDEKNNLYPFTLPVSIATQFKDYSFVKISGRWLGIGNNHFLIATKIIETTYPKSVKKNITVTKLRNHLTCYYCGRNIKKTDYFSFDDGMNLECKNCSNFRSQLSPRQFLNRIKRIANYRLKLKKLN